MTANAYFNRAGLASPRFSMIGVAIMAMPTLSTILDSGDASIFNVRSTTAGPQGAIRTRVSILLFRGWDHAETMSQSRAMNRCKREPG